MGDWLPLTLGGSPISGGGQGREVPSTSLYRTLTPSGPARSWPELPPAHLLFSASLATPVPFSR